MGKLLTDKDVGEIIQKVIDDPDAHFGDAGVYKKFFVRLTEVVCEFFGGESAVDACPPLGELPWCINVYVNESVPPDGGIFKDYDLDITWIDGEEVYLG